MTKEETRALLSRIKGAFPTAFRGMSGEDGQQMLDTWADCLREEETREVRERLEEYIMREKRGFPPALGALLEEKEQRRRREMRRYIHKLRQRKSEEEKGVREHE